jgi:hypothetical protein
MKCAASYSKKSIKLYWSEIRQIYQGKTILEIRICQSQKRRPRGQKPLFEVFRIRPDQGKTDKFPVKKINIFYSTKCFSDQKTSMNDYLAPEKVQEAELSNESNLQKLLAWTWQTLCWENTKKNIAKLKNYDI